MSSDFSIDQYQSDKSSRFSQLLLLDQSGMLRDSNHAIFDAHALLNQNLIEWLPFLESIFPVISDMKVGSPELHFTKIETRQSELPGIYDFTFRKIDLEEEVYILWSIYDYTDLYQHLIQFQQRRNELEIHRQLLEKRNAQLKKKADLLELENLMLWEVTQPNITSNESLHTEDLSVFFNQLPAKPHLPVEQYQYFANQLSRILDSFFSPFKLEEQQTTFQLGEQLQAWTSKVEEQGSVIDLELELPKHLETQSTTIFQPTFQSIFPIITVLSQLDQPIHVKMQVMDQHQQYPRARLRYEVQISAQRESFVLDPAAQNELNFRISLIQKVLQYKGGLFQSTSEMTRVPLDFTVYIPL